MKALLIEDDPVQRQVIQASLHKLGFQVITANDGLTGLQIICTTPRIAIAIVDWHCEPLSGYAFLCAVRADQRYRDLKVMMLTAEDSETLVRQAIAQRTDAYIIKPLRPSFLAEKLTALGLVVEEPGHGVPAGKRRVGIPPEAQTAKVPRVAEDPTAAQNEEEYDAVEAEEFPTQASLEES